MKHNNKLIALTMVVGALALSSCENQDIEFPDYEGGISVYFPYQAPVRTLVMGTDEYDTSLDKAHKCKISATMGGAYKGRNIVANVAVADTLVKNLKMADGSDVKVMPASYYQLSSDQIEFKGNLTGSIEVQLTDAFFADAVSATKSYVIPILMTDQTGADRILSGDYEGKNDVVNPKTAPARLNADAWTEVPKDYTLFCVTYKSKYDAYYSRCGQYKLNGASAVQIPAESKAKWKTKEENGTITYHFDSVIDGADCSTVTVGLNTVNYSVEYKQIDLGTDISATLQLSFDASGKCTITSLTPGVTATGNGSFTDLGAKKAWGNKDRDLLVLKYTLNDGTNTVECDETLVWKRSGVSAEELSLSYVAE